MKAGFALRDISPKKPYPMAGFDLRKQEAVGIHDALAVRALAVEEQGLVKVMIACDLLGVSMELTDMVRSEVKKRLNLSPEAVQVSALHTHAAPQSVFSSFPCFDPDYRQEIAVRAGEAAEEAVSDMTETRMTYHPGTVEGVASLRDGDREHSGFAMPCDCLAFTFAEEKEPILLLSYACHPTVLNEKNLENSRDLVWGCETALVSGMGRVRTFFVNGACADLSTRYTRKESTFAEAARLGRVWADAVIRMLSAKDTDAATTAKTTDAGTTAATTAAKIAELPAIMAAEPLFVPPATYFTEEEKQQVLAYLEQKIATCTDKEQQREYVSCRSVLQRPWYGKNKDGSPREGETVNLGLMSIGEVLIAFLPFEYAQKDAVLLKKKLEDSLGRPALILCYSNGYEGYLPSGRPVDRDSGYSDMSSAFVFNAKELVADKILSMAGNDPAED